MYCIKGLPIERGLVYRLPSIPINYDATLTPQTVEEADRVFAEHIQPRLPSNGRKLEEKKCSFRHLFQARLIAAFHRGCVRYPRNRNDSGFSEVRLQVIDAAVAAGLFIDVRSPKGRSPCMSRLMPAYDLSDWCAGDPWTFDPPISKQYVFLRDRKTKEELLFDPSLTVPATTQRILELVNTANAQHEITCWRENICDPSEVDHLRLRPVHFARFTDNFDLHGRIYTDQYGHQALNKIERASIQIDGAPTVELDFSGMHPRLLYHLEGIDYQGDPYALWRDNTTQTMRLLAKTLTNALINADTPKAAISACNYKARLYTDSRDAKGRRTRKRGKALKKALSLAEAIRQTGLTFSEIYPLVLAYHPRIAHYFGSDAGIKLMRTDSKIALDILHHFAKQGVPCLGVHDSFIVQEEYKEELRGAMRAAYKRHNARKFNPVIKE